MGESMVNINKNKFFEEIVFFISLALAVITGFFAVFHFEAIDFNVIGILTTLMLISLAFEKYQLLDYVAVTVLAKADSERKAAMFMVLLTAVLGMLITNDVALITVVPITLSMSRKVGINPYKLIVLEALSANIGSSLTPFGNPQNLFLYNFFKFDFSGFITSVSLFVVLGLLLLLVPISMLDNQKFEQLHERGVIASKLSVSVYGLLFLSSVICIVMRINIIYVLLAVLSVVILRDRELVFKLDYFLLGTFICFFIFVDHIGQLPWMEEMVLSVLSSERHIFYMSVILSQGISNVPAAILLSAFTAKREALLIGVSVGGLGTMIASLANLIAYKFYSKQYPTRKYHRYFVLLNFSILLFFLVLYYFLLS